MRELVAAVRLREGQEPSAEMLLKTYNTAMSTAAEALIELWTAGKPAPAPEGHLDVAMAVDAEGQTVGFNVYLVWGEVRVLGVTQMRKELAAPQGSGGPM